MVRKSMRRRRKMVEVVEKNLKEDRGCEKEEDDGNDVTMTR